MILPLSPDVATERMATLSEVERIAARMIARGSSLHGVAHNMEKSYAYVSKDLVIRIKGRLGATSLPMVGYIVGLAEGVE